MRFRLNLLARTLALPLVLAGCERDTPTDVVRDRSEVGDPVLAMLSASGEWEVAAHPVDLVDEIEDHVIVQSAEIALVPAALTEAVERDRSWYAEDGERYDALYIHADGRAYGRRSVATAVQRVPNAGNAFGAFAGVGDASEPSIRRDGEAFPPSSSRSAGLLDAMASGRPDPVSPQALITTNWQDDRRTRAGGGLTDYPSRVIGALSASGGTQDGACTGTKVGPRAVLTAAHCVMGSSGIVTFSGRFNPGQTSTTTPNGSIPWSGVFLRDWRIHRKYDYAIIYLQDSPVTVGLGWMGIGWWNSAPGYDGRMASLFGYPCGANRDCGTIAKQRCKASPRRDKRCDGWMYGHGRKLTTSSFRSDDLLQYDHDTSTGQNGSAVYTWYGTTPMVMAVNTHSWDGVSMGPRFRQSMWNDVCSWIGHPVAQSAYATHPLCN